MKWSEFTSSRPDIRRRTEKEFVWMRRHAFYYYGIRTGDFITAEDFAHSVIKNFISRLQSARELNRAYFVKQVKYAFITAIDQTNRSNAAYKEMAYQSYSHTDSVPGGYNSCAYLENGSPDQEMTCTDIREIFTSVLDNFKRRDQKIILYRILGYSAKEIMSLLLHEGVAITDNLIFVIYHQFKKELKCQLERLEIIFAKEVDHES